MGVICEMLSMCKSTGGFFCGFVPFYDGMFVCESGIRKTECAVVALCCWFKEPGSRVGGHVIN